MPVGARFITRRSVLVVLAVLASVACVVYGKNWTPLWIYVSAAGGMVLTTIFGRRRAPLGIVLITACSSSVRIVTTASMLI